MVSCNDSLLALWAVLARSISAIDSEYKRLWQATNRYIQIYLYLGIGHQIAVYILEVVSSEQGSISQAGENHTVK